MLTRYKLSDTSGITMNGAYAMDSAAVRYTDAVKLRQYPGSGENSALFLQITGSIAVTRQVSFDGSEWVTPYALNLKNISSMFTLQHGDSSGLYSLYEADSSQILAPYIRFALTAARGATITSCYYIEEITE